MPRIVAISVDRERWRSLRRFVIVPIGPRPGNLWVTGESARRLGKEPVEFVAGGVERALRLFGTVVDGGAAVFMDGAAEKTVGRHFSQRRVVVQVADDLPAQAPEIVHMLANGFG